MKIITWNVNGIRAVTQKGFHDFFARQNPDMLCLQETKAHPDQLNDAIKSPGEWQSDWSAAQRAGYSGVATFYKTKPNAVAHGIGIPKFDTEGRILITEFKDFSLYNIYFPNGGSGEERHQYKLQFLKRFQFHLAKRLKAGDKLVVVGDYNIAYLDIDVYNPISLSSESGFLPEERRWMVDFLEGGFIDSFRYFHPDAKNRYSWWSYFQNARMANRGWRIDHICVSRNLERHLQSCEILDDQTGSDHAPVVLEMKF